MISFMQLLKNAQLNPPKVDREYGDHKSHGAHEGTRSMMQARPWFNNSP
jgi:hypothetical protein